MKIMLVCAGGMSTGILMKKMEKYALEKNFDLEVKAYSVQDYDRHLQNYEVVLLGPQISYKFEEMKANVELPIGIIPSFDYAIGNVENIIKLVNDLLK